MCGAKNIGVNELEKETNAEATLIGEGLTGSKLYSAEAMAFIPLSTVEFPLVEQQHLLPGRERHGNRFRHRENATNGIELHVCII